MGPAHPEVFHSLQLVTQAWQPTQTFRSITRASCVMALLSSYVYGRPYPRGDYAFLNRPAK
jgi:hypothetical protein